MKLEGKEGRGKRSKERTKEAKEYGRNRTVHNTAFGSWKAKKIRCAQSIRRANRRH